MDFHNLSCLKLLPIVLWIVSTMLPKPAWSGLKNAVGCKFNNIRKGEQHPQGNTIFLGMRNKVTSQVALFWRKVDKWWGLCSDAAGVRLTPLALSDVTAWKDYSIFSTSFCFRCTTFIPTRTLEKLKLSSKILQI